VRTLVSLPEGTIATAGRYLARALYTAEDVVHQAKTAAANARGIPDEGAVGAMAAAVRSCAEAVSTRIAGRMRVLGLEVDWTIDAISRGSSLQPFPLDLRDGAKAIALLAENVLSLDLVLREVLGQVAQVDPVSAYLLTNAILAYEEQLDAAGLLALVASRDPEEAVLAVGTEALEARRGY